MCNRPDHISALFSVHFSLLRLLFITILTLQLSSSQEKISNLHAVENNMVAGYMVIWLTIAEVVNKIH